MVRSTLCIGQLTKTLVWADSTQTSEIFCATRTSTKLSLAVANVALHFPQKKLRHSTSFELAMARALSQSVHSTLQWSIASQLLSLQALASKLRLGKSGPRLYNQRPELLQGNDYRA